LRGRLYLKRDCAAPHSLIESFTVRRGDLKLSVKFNPAEKELHVEVLQEKGADS
jgi:hypothetical protein